MNAHHKEALAKPENAPRLNDTQLRVVIPLPDGSTINDGDAPRLCAGKPAVAVTMDRADWIKFSSELKMMSEEVDDLLGFPKPPKKGAEKVTHEAAAGHVSNKT